MVVLDVELDYLVPVLISCILRDLLFYRFTQVGDGQKIVEACRWVRARRLIKSTVVFLPGYPRLEANVHLSQIS